MEKLIEFVGNNYAWFLTITIILLFALIGYIYDTRKNKNDLLKKSEEEMNEMDLENIMVPEGKSLSDMVTTSKNINPETKGVELTDSSILHGESSQNNPNFTAVQEEPITNINATENTNVMNTEENVNNVASPVNQTVAPQVTPQAVQQSPENPVNPVNNN